MLTAIACIPILIWSYLLLGRHGFWRVSRQVAATDASRRTESIVVAVIPARNEAGGIERAVTSLMRQDFPALLRIIIVDDHSEDGTADLARDAARRIGEKSRVTVLQGRPLPTGWTGKMWAVAQGVVEATKFSPDFLLLTDGDIEHGLGSVGELLRIAESGGYDLVSYMVKLACRTPAEKTLIPAFVFFFFLLYPPAAIRSRQSNIGGAAGGCMLIRARALPQAGGIERIRSEVIDDCALAKAVKRSGGRVWLGLTEHTRSLRKYQSWSEIERMIARTAFNQLRHSWILLAGTCLGLIVTYVLPILLLFAGHLWPAILGLAAWVLMSIAYFPLVKFYERSAIWSITLPFAAVFYMAASVHSAVQYARGRGGQWKGRSQDATNRFNGAAR